MAEWSPGQYALLGSAIGALAAVSGAVIVSVAAHYREKVALARQDLRDTAYLVATVAGALERFSADCVDVTNDDGRYRGEADADGNLAPQVDLPFFQPGEFQVEWKVLPADLIFPILDLPSRVLEANRIIAGAAEHAFPPEYDELFEQRRYQYAELGIQAARLAARLRKHAGFPSREQHPEWDAIRHLEAEKQAIERIWERRQHGQPPPPAAVPKG